MHRKEKRLPFHFPMELLVFGIQGDKSPWIPPAPRTTEQRLPCFHSISGCIKVPAAAEALLSRRSRLLFLTSMRKELWHGPVF